MNTRVVVNVNYTLTNRHVIVKDFTFVLPAVSEHWSCGECQLYIDKSSCNL